MSVRVLWCLRILAVSSKIVAVLNVTRRKRNRQVKLNSICRIWILSTKLFSNKRTITVAVIVEPRTWAFTALLKTTKTVILFLIKSLKLDHLQVTLTNRISAKTPIKWAKLNRMSNNKLFYLMAEYEVKRKLIKKRSHLLAYLNLKMKMRRDLILIGLPLIRLCSSNQ